MTTQNLVSYLQEHGINVIGFNDNEITVTNTTTDFVINADNGIKLCKQVDIISANLQSVRSYLGY